MPMAAAQAQRAPLCLTDGKRSPVCFDPLYSHKSRSRESDARYGRHNGDGEKRSIGSKATNSRPAARGRAGPAVNALRLAC